MNSLRRLWLSYGQFLLLLLILVLLLVILLRPLVRDLKAIMMSVFANFVILFGIFAFNLIRMKLNVCCCWNCRQWNHTHIAWIKWIKLARLDTCEWANDQAIRMKLVNKCEKKTYEYYTLKSQQNHTFQRSYGNTTYWIEFMKQEERTGEKMENGLKNNK